MKHAALILLIVILTGTATFFNSCRKPEDNGNQIWTTEEKVYAAEIAALQDLADQNLTTWNKSMDSLAAVEKLYQFFVNNPNVASAEVTGQGIAIEYSNGMRGAMVLNTLDSPVNSTESLNLPVHAEYGSPREKSVVNNKKMILFEAAYSDFKKFSDDMILQHRANLPKVNYSLDKVYIDEEATLERYTQLSGYGIIELASHGFSWKWPPIHGEDIYMLTGETPGVDMKYPADLKFKNIIIANYHSKSKYWISEKFIANHNNFSKDTVLFYGSFCYSSLGKWPGLQKTFGNGVYMGYDWEVPADWDARWAINMISFLTDTTNNPLKNIIDWMKDPALPKATRRASDIFDVHVMFAGDSTLTLLPDTTTTVKDIDGNIYHVKKIGKQFWTVENLRTTRLNDGTAIPNVTKSSSWSTLTSMAYCWYNNDPVNKPDYGALYNWYAVDSKKLAPRGWHVPTLSDWNVMIDFLGGPGYAGSKLKETGTKHWKAPNDKATNSSGFTGLPGGTIYAELWNNIYFNSMGSSGYFWTSTAFDSQFTHFFELLSSYELVQWGQMYKELGMSVRCVRN